MSHLGTIFHHLQRQLFPSLADEMGARSALDQQFCEVVALPDPGRFTPRYEWCWNGAPPCPRTWLAHAFIAKSVYQFPSTAALIDALQTRPTLRRLCGWESAGNIPSEPTFSRAFTAFAKDRLSQQIHEHMIKTHAGPKLVGHFSRDATAIEAPERPTPQCGAVSAPQIGELWQWDASPHRWFPGCSLEFPCSTCSMIAAASLSVPKGGKRPRIGG